MKDHVHDCTGPTATCACGYTFTVPRICVSVEVTDGSRVLVSDGFNCDERETAARALESAARRIRNIQ